MTFTPFLIALSLTCFAVHTASTAKEEMVGIFAAIVAIVSFAVSLFLAPWIVQAALLIFVVVFWRKLVPQ
ncbi:hypothetical protein IQ250_20935 [Pseudanabaenaceae cyanobacterium LEGE 13415]|nr:hypothetical protein [Pseudanabaenaceae cyanobacterium LEGE 13415]